MEKDDREEGEMEREIESEMKMMMMMRKGVMEIRGETMKHDGKKTNQG